MNSFACRLSLGLTLLAACASAPAAAPAKPNVILIYSDDHGYADLGVQGSVTDVKTPHLDALARDGVRFRRGYVSAPQCVPSRAGVLTGRYQQRFGVEDNGKGPLPLAELTIAERLKPAGYATGQVGKWHLDIRVGAGSHGKKGNAVLREFMPHAQGFDEYWRGEMRQYFASHDLQGKPFADAPHLVVDQRFRVDVQTEAALAFLDRHARAPFFLYLAWFAPHVPLEAPQEYLARFADVKDPTRHTALAMISAMDDGMGRLRAKLRELGIERNTLVFFIGDNGAPIHEGAWDGSLKRPLVGEKGMLTDGGVRTPFVAAWPGVFPAGQVYEPPVIALDVAATAVAIAGLPPDPQLDGVNLIPYLTGAKSGNPHEALYWRWRSQAAVRADHWKLIRLGADRRYLFDLDSSEGETRDRLAEQPQVAADLEKKLAAWVATLEPPGLPGDLVGQDAMFYHNHVDKSVPWPAPRGAQAAPGSIQGWLGRNCRLTLQDGALVVTPDAAAKAALPFLAQTNLDVAGPIAVGLRLRCVQGGAGAIQWRLADQKDFLPEQKTPFQIPPSADWQTLRIAAPATGRVVHLRVILPKGQPAAVASIELFSGASARPAKVWTFASSFEPWRRHATPLARNNPAQICDFFLHP